MTIDYDNPQVEAVLNDVKQRFGSFRDFTLRLSRFISTTCDFSFEPTESDRSEALYLIRVASKYDQIIENMEYEPEEDEE